MRCCRAYFCLQENIIFHCARLFNVVVNGIQRYIYWYFLCFESERDYSGKLLEWICQQQHVIIYLSTKSALVVLCRWYHSRNICDTCILSCVSGSTKEFILRKSFCIFGTDYNNLLWYLSKHNLESWCWGRWTRLGFQKRLTFFKTREQLIQRNFIEIKFLIRFANQKKKEACNFRNLVNNSIPDSEALDRHVASTVWKICQLFWIWYYDLRYIV